MKWLLAILVLAVVSCSAESEVVAQSEVTTNSIGMKLKLIPAGTFMMGSEEGSDNEKPVHQVTLTKPFLLGVYEVTQEQYERVMGVNPSEFKGSQNPVEQVSWNDAVEFCRKLSELPKEKAAGHVYRLPTEAEWEHACRAGTTTKFSFGESASDLSDHGWFVDNSGDRRIDALEIIKTDPDNVRRRFFDNNIHPHPVGQKRPNPWGLYDMHGNVSEWCQDCYGDYPSDAVTDPTASPTSSCPAVRGGSWYGTVEFCQSANRTGGYPSLRDFSIGFRVACVPSGQPSE